MSQRSGAGRPGLTAGDLLAHVRDDGPVTRSQLLDTTGLSRTALTQLIETLLAEGLLVERAGRSTGGRPPTQLAFNAGGGIILAAWLGRTRSGVAVVDLAAEVLRSRIVPGGLDAGPDAVLDRTEAALDGLLGEIGRSRDDVRGIGMGVPWPVDPASRAAQAGTLPQMPVGWQGIALAEELRARFGVPAVVDKDVNLAALAEHRLNWRQTTDDVVFLKAGAGIGCGIVSGGVVQRGSQGAAGELGHLWVGAAGDEPCACGNSGCLETVASGMTLLRRLREQGREGVDGRDVVRLAEAGDAEAIRLLRDAGRALGEALATAVNLLNPAVIVVGGDLSTSDELLAGVRESVYQRATAHSTRTLRILRSQLGERAGLVGPAVAVLDIVLAPETLEGRLAVDGVPA